MRHGADARAQLFRLQEKPTPEKLGMLYARQHYTLALSVASTQGLDDAGVADIHRQYGDYLYGRGDYDAAMAQYVQTIGSVQPSYVIRKVRP
jgi:Tfp pilus assembly protein PilF